MLTDKSLYINGEWTVATGTRFASHDPATGKIVWEGYSASIGDVEKAVLTAHKGFEVWSKTPYESRKNILQIFAQLLNAEKQELALIISTETGKPLWESLEEVKAMINKVDISIEAHETRAAEVSREQPNATSTTSFHPHGVIAVLGPFNFPGHLPNGHIIPALLAGNAVIFKPSELTPLVAEKTCKIWELAGLSPGALSLLQGGQETGQALAVHPGIDGLFFTGSWKTGRWLSENFAAHPGKILALEMGGNNPLVVTDISDFMAAAYITIQSAYLTSGQRCTCARRLIVPEGKTGDMFIQVLKSMISGIRVGAYDSPIQPFMGPVITPKTAQGFLDWQKWLCSHGATEIIPMRQLKEGLTFLTPGLIDVTAMQEKPDEEVFGPLLQLIRVPDFNAAIEEANNTAYGLAAGLLSDDRIQYEEFKSRIKAGIINWNMPLTGASSKAPFGGIGNSGNHRPSAYYAVDYCNYPVASLEAPKIKLPAVLPPGLEFSQQAWV